MEEQYFWYSFADFPVPIGGAHFFQYNSKATKYNTAYLSTDNHLLIQCVWLHRNSTLFLAYLKVSIAHET